MKILKRTSKQLYIKKKKDVTQIFALRMQGHTELMDKAKMSCTQGKRNIRYYFHLLRVRHHSQFFLFLFCTAGVGKGKVESLPHPLSFPTKQSFDLWGRKLFCSLHSKCGNIQELNIYTSF